MSTKTRAILKAFYAAGYPPSEGGYDDLIDTLVSWNEDVATNAVAKAGSNAAKVLIPDNLLQDAATVSAGTLEAMFPIHYQIAPAAESATAVHAAITLPTAGTTTVTTAITDPDYPRTLTITGNASGIVGNVVIVGTNFSGTAITDTIAASGTDTVEGIKAFKTVTSITVPVRNAAANTISIGLAKKFGLPHIVSNASLLLVKLFNGAADNGTLAVDVDEIEKNLFSLDGTPDGAKFVDLYYLV